MRIRPTGLVLILLVLLPAVPALARPDVPAGGRGLPACENLVVTLSNADLRVTVRPGAASHLTARAVAPGQAADEATPAGPSPVEARLDGRKLRIARAAAAGDGRLRVEIVLGSVRTVRIDGGGLDAAVAAPPRGGRFTVALSLEGSDAELSGVAGGVLAGDASFFRSRQSSGDLTVRLEGGGAEIEGHRGKLVLSGKQSEFGLRDVGQVALRLDGGRMEISDAQGQLGGSVRRGALLLVSEWSGEADLVAVGSALELRNFRPDPPVLKVKAQDSDVVIEALPAGLLELEQTGGELRLRDVENLEGKITTGMRARVGIARVSGAWNGVFQDSEARIDAVGHLGAELYNTVMELDGARDLELIAHSSQITATAVERITHLNLVTSEAELELAGGSRAEVMVQGLSRATIRLPRPCFVLVEDQKTEAGPALDVTGCRVGEPPAGADEDDDASFLTGVVGGGSKLTVREAF